MNEMSELAKLQAENARLIALLELHGIEWHPPQSVATQSGVDDDGRIHIRIHARVPSFFMNAGLIIVYTIERRVDLSQGPQ